MPSDTKKNHDEESTFPKYSAGFFVAGVLVLIVTAIVDKFTYSEDGQDRCFNSYIVGAIMSIVGFFCTFGRVG